MSLQVYAQPFISKGTYSNVQELSLTPRAADFASQPPGLAAKQQGCSDAILTFETAKLNIESQHH